MACRAARRFLLCVYLSTDVHYCSRFSLGFAVSFAVSIFLLSAQLRLVRASNGFAVNGNKMRGKRAQPNKPCHFIYISGCLVLGEVGLVGQIRCLNAEFGGVHRVDES